MTKGPFNPTCYGGLNGLFGYDLGKEVEEMAWIPRLIENHLEKTMETFPAVLVTGPRQVGKSTLLQKVATDYEYITFDNPILLQQALEDPNLFFMNHPGRLILDEIQYAPALFPYLKMKIDEARFVDLKSNQKTKCMFLLSGSQAFHLMENISESLAGRIAIIPMQGISYRERACIDCVLPFIPNEHYLTVRKDSLKVIDDLWEIIHRGSMPEMVASKSDWETFYSAYVSTYIERDVNQLTQVQDKDSFIRFMSAVAARSGELINYESVGRDVGISAQTVKRWIHILETAGIVLLLHPYHNNHLKRIVKTPKLYFMDTGLMAWLTRWITPDAMQYGAKAGQFFETWVISEIVKSQLNAGESLRNLYYYRDTDQKEIDLVMEIGRTVYPIEIKYSAQPTKKMASAFDRLKPIAEAGDLEIGDGAIINRYQELYYIDEKIRAIPIEYL